MSTNESVPLSILALELDTSRVQLESQLAGQYFADDVGRPAVDRNTARQVIAEHQAARAAAAELRRAQLAATSARCAELRRQSVRGGIPTKPDFDAVGNLLAAEPQASRGSYKQMSLGRG